MMSLMITLKQHTIKEWERSKYQNFMICEDRRDI